MFLFFALFFACFTVKLGAFFFFRLLEHKNSPGFTVNVKIPEKGKHIIGSLARLPHPLELVHKLQTDTAVLITPAAWCGGANLKQNK